MRTPDVDAPSVVFKSELPYFSYKKHWKGMPTQDGEQLVCMRGGIFFRWLLIDRYWENAFFRYVSFWRLNILTDRELAATVFAFCKMANMHLKRRPKFCFPAMQLRGVKFEDEDEIIIDGMFVYGGNNAVKLLVKQYERASR